MFKEKVAQLRDRMGLPAKKALRSQKTAGASQEISTGHVSANAPAERVPQADVQIEPPHLENASSKAAFGRPGPNDAQDPVRLAHGKLPESLHETPESTASNQEMKESPPLERSVIRNEIAAESLTNRVSENKAERLWNTAYIRLRAENPMILIIFDHFMSTHASTHRWTGISRRRASQIKPNTTTNSIELMEKFLNGFLNNNMVGVSETDETKSDESSVQSKTQHLNTSKSEFLRAQLRESVWRSESLIIPWAISCLTFEAILKPDFHYRDHASQIIQLISKIEWYIGLCRLQTDHDGDHDDRLSEGLGASTQSGALVELYHAILTYLVYVTCGQSTAMRSLWDDDNETRIELLFETIRNREDVFETWRTQKLRVQLASLLAEETKPDEVVAESSMEGSEGVEDVNEIEKLLPKLDAYEQPSLNLDTTEISSAETISEWVCKSQEYRSWIKGSGNRVLWLTAGPGTTKTNLLQEVLQQLAQEAPEDKDAPYLPQRMAYFTCDAGRPQQSSPLSVIKGLIRQIITDQPSLSQTLQLKFETTVRASFNNPEDLYAMSTVFYSMLDDEDFQPTCFIVDAIEELAPVNTPTDSISDPTEGGFENGLFRFNTLRDLIKIVISTAAASDKVRWLISADSQKYEILFSTGVAENLRVDLGFHVDEVKRATVDLAMAKLPCMPGFNAPLCERIRQKLEKITDSNPLWLEMAFGIFKTSSIPWDAPETLDQLQVSAPTIDDLYQRRKLHIDGLGVRDRTFCINALLTTFIAYEPLLDFEMRAAIELPAEVDLDTLINTLLPEFLVFHEGDGGRSRWVQFIHHSAFEFVGRNFLREQIQKTHYFVAVWCIQSFSQDFGSENRPLYAARHWLEHLCQLVEPEYAEFTRDSMDRFLSEHLTEWLEILDSEGEISEILATMARLDFALATKNLPSDMVVQRHTVRHLRRLLKHIDMSRSYSLGTEANSIRNEIKNSIAFSSGLGSLREELIKKQFPWMISWPVLGPEGASGDCLHTMSHDDYIRECAFSPDSRIVASCHDEEFVRLWDVVTGKLQHVLKGFDGYVYSVCFSHSGPNGTPLLAACERRAIRIWDFVTLKEVKVLVSLKDDAVRSDSANAESNKEDGSDRYPHDSHMKGAVGEISNSGDNDDDDNDDDDDGDGDGDEPDTSLFVYSISITRRGDKLAAATGSELIVWDIPGFRPRVWQDDKGEYGSGIHRLKFSPDGLLLAASVGTRITIWDVKEGKLLFWLPEKGPIPSESSDSHGSSDEWSDQAQEGESGSQKDESFGHTDRIDGLDFSPDSNFLTSGSDDSTARIWDLRTRKTVAILEYHKNEVNSVSFSADGTTLASGSTDTRISIWKQKSAGNWGDGEVRESPDSILQGHQRVIWSVAFAPRGNLLASSDAAGSLKIWNAEPSLSGSEMSIIQQGGPGHSSPVSYVTFSPDGRTIASGCENGVVCLWDGVTGVRRCTMDNPHSYTITSLVFSNDGKILVSTSKDSTAVVWHIDGNSTPRTQILTGHSDWVRGAAISHNKEFAATASDDETVILWRILSSPRSEEAQAKSDKAIAGIFTGHRDYVYSVAFSPDDTRLASVGDDKHVMVWDLNVAGNQELPQHDMSNKRLTDYMRGVAFSSGGHNILSTSEDGTVAVWKPGLKDNEQCVLILDPQLEDNEDKRIWPAFNSMRISKCQAGVLLTEFGVWPFDVSEDALTKTVQDSAALLPRLEPSKCPPWAINDSRSAITWNKHECISLPEGYHVSHNAFWVHERSVAIGCDSGQVLLFRFSDKDDWPDLQKL